MAEKKIIIAAHRGDKKYCPENTMPAFLAAHKAGVEMIETDLHMTSDGELVLIHDRNTLRTTGVDGIVDQMTLAEVKALDAGSWFSEEFAGTRIPTVREFIEWASKTELEINWELKDYPCYVGDEKAFESADKLIALIREFGMEKRSVLNSFSDRVLEYIRKKYGKEFPLLGQGIYRCRCSVDEPEMDEKDLFDWCCMYSEEEGKTPVDFRASFDYCLEHGLMIAVLLPDTLEHYKKGVEYGCTMFTSNDIYAAIDVLKQLGVRD